MASLEFWRASDRRCTAGAGRPDPLPTGDGILLVERAEGGRGERDSVRGCGEGRARPGVRGDGCASPLAGVAAPLDWAVEATDWRLVGSDIEGRRLLSPAGAARFDPAAPMVDCLLDGAPGGRMEGLEMLALGRVTPFPATTRFTVLVVLAMLPALPVRGGVGAATDGRGRVGVALVGVDTAGLLPGVELRDAVPLLILLALEPEPAFASVPGLVLGGLALITRTWLGRTKTP